MRTIVVEDYEEMSRVAAQEFLNQPVHYWRKHTEADV